MRYEDLLPNTFQNVNSWLWQHLDWMDEYSDMPERIRASELTAWEILHNFEDYILYEDNDLLIMNKPAKILSHHRDNELVGLSELVSYVRGPHAVSAHRLDRDTTGIMLYTKNQEAKASIDHQFYNKRRSGLRKRYLAIVDGHYPMETRDSLDILHLPLVIEHNPKIRRTTRVATPDDDPSKIVQSETHLYAVGYYQDTNGRPATLMDINIITGKTHQIRVTTDYRNCPIVADNRYNDVENGIPASRQMLHSWQLSIKHPTSNNRMTFEAPIPDDMNEVFSTLTEVEPLHIMPNRVIE